MCRLLSTFLTLVRLTLYPSLSSSPWILLYPQRGFSLASRTISSCNSAATGGLPVPLSCRKVYLRLTNSLCQRSTVPGLNSTMASSSLRPVPLEHILN